MKVPSRVLREGIFLIRKICFMKNIFPGFIICFVSSFFVMISSCENRHKKAEENFSDCFCKAYSGNADPTGKKMQIGFTVLDNYLRKNGFLGSGKIADYKKFAADTNVIVIPATADSLEYIELALYGGLAGEPDANAIGKCMDSLIAQAATLDTTSAAYVAAQGFKSMEAAGAPDSKAFFDNYFSKVSE